jgi:hypothetical protein
VSTLKRLQIILSALYWFVVLVLLWFGYAGDAEIDRASTTPITHSAAFDVAAGFALAAVVYGVACAVWWVSARLTRRVA